MRTAFANLSDSALLAQCKVDTYRASGPGGQKRNKTSSAVRLRHEPTGLIVIAEESRSQHENKAKAILRLRRAFFLQLREVPHDTPASHPDFTAGSDGRLHFASAKDPRFWPTAGVVLDVLASAGGQVSTAAAALGTGTANLVDFLALDPRLWQEANRLRIECGLTALKS